MTLKFSSWGPVSEAPALVKSRPLINQYLTGTKKVATTYNSWHPAVPSTYD